MKKSLKFLFAILLFTGCATVTHIPYSESYYGLDFTKYTEKGFLFTPDMYSGEYTSIAMVSIEVFPEYTRMKPIYGTDNQVLSPAMWATIPTNTEEIMDKFYNKIIEMGGNALINFKMDAVSKSEDIGRGHTLSVSGTRITGFAIKRK